MTIMFESITTSRYHVGKYYYVTWLLVALTLSSVTVYIKLIQELEIH